MLSSTPMEDDLRLLVLADDPLARAGLAALLGDIPGFLVVAQVHSNILSDANGEAYADLPVDLIVWDMGWEPAERVADEPVVQSVPVLALVADQESAGIAWRLGCRGVITREFDEGRLVAAMSAVAMGFVVVAPPLMNSFLSPRAGVESTFNDLTPRESEVLSLLAEGLTNRAIAQRLAISDHTVKFHVNAILNKLDAQSRTDAVVRATRLGILAL